MQKGTADKVVRLSDKRVKELQELLIAECELDTTTETASEAGVAILRFIVAKYHSNQPLTTKETSNEKPTR